MKCIRILFLSSIISLLISNSLVADSNLEFAKKLSGFYPEIALKYVEEYKQSQAEKSLLIRHNQYGEVMYHIYFNLAKYSVDLKSKLNFLKTSRKHFDLVFKSDFKLGMRDRKYALMLKKDLIDYRIDNITKNKLLIEVNGHLLSANRSFNLVTTKLKVRFEDGIRQALRRGDLFIKTTEFKQWFVETYTPFTISIMCRYECFASSLWIIGNKKKVSLIEANKIIKDANEVLKKIESIVPVASIMTSQARTLGFLTTYGDESKANENKKNALKIFDKVLEMKSNVDNNLLENIKKNALIGKLEMALASNDFLLAFNTYEAFNNLPKNQLLNNADIEIYSMVLFIFSKKNKKQKSQKLSIEINKIKRLLKKHFELITPLK